MQLISRFEHDSRLDQAVSAGQRVARLIQPGKVRDALHGVWLGHPLHPVLVQAPVGAWLSASLVDVLGDHRSARRLAAAGLAASVPAAVAGAADWSEQHEQQMRVGVVHAAANLVAMSLYGASLLARGPWLGPVPRLAGTGPGHHAVELPAVQTLLAGSARIEAILRDPRVAAATLTGSGPAGSSVAAIAGSEIKKVLLELGGSDPFVVMPSADLRRAAQVAAMARCLNNGQSCIAAKRFIVHDAVYDEFERLFTGQMSAKTVGDPMAGGADVGPLASEQQREDVEHLVADAAAKGAKVLCGGTAPEGPGFYYPPTVLAGITPEMRVHR